jgi:hypothetical protein
LENRGHEVRSVGEGFPSGSPDRSILAAADPVGAVIFSTDTHWQSFIKGVSSGKDRGRFRRAGRVLFNCPHDVAIQRLELLIEVIEREYSVAERGGGQLIMRITGGNFRVER